jgi:hypothetical protein
MYEGGALNRTRAYMHSETLLRSVVYSSYAFYMVLACNQMRYNAALCQIKPAFVYTIYKRCLTACMVNNNLINFNFLNFYRHRI